MSIMLIHHYNISDCPNYQPIRRKLKTQARRKLKDLSVDA